MADVSPARARPRLADINPAEATFYASPMHHTQLGGELMDKLKTVEDPLLRAAVLDLFRANEAFRAAYQDFERTGNRILIDRAADRIDEARERASFAQSRRP